MPLPSFSGIISPFTDRKKPTPTEPPTTNAASDDNLASVKAAAWAWYQHGSGSESKPIIREFGLKRPITTLPKPSRYKLEAIRFAQISVQDISQTPNPRISLLDSYDVASISRRLSDLLDPTDRNNCSFRSFESEILDLGREIETKSTKKTKKFRGFWRRPSVMCGKMEDVVIGSLARPPEKQPRRSMGRRSTTAHGLPADL